MAEMKRSDYVVNKNMEHINPEIVGLVRRVAKDGSWADVSWRSGSEIWTKRMKQNVLRVVG